MFMKYLLHALAVIFLTSTVNPLSAGEIVIYGGAQKPGDLSWSTAGGSITDVAGDFGGTFGFRYSKGRVIGFEQSIGYSPRFAQPNVRAFQTDSNLLIQLPGKIVPYGTVGIGLVRTWGDFPAEMDAGQIASFVFSIGNKFAINYGGGVKVRRLWGPMGINVDVRGYTLPGVGFETEDIRVTDKNFNFIQTTAGMVITW